jgi:hypothetical protein
MFPRRAAAANVASWHAPLLGGDRDLGGEPKPQDHQRLDAIRFDDQQIAVDEPRIKLCEA